MKRTLAIIILTQLFILNLAALCSAGTVRTTALPTPEIYITPASYTAHRIGETFSVNVNIENLDVDWKLIGVQFRVLYDQTLLNATDVEEGSFLQQFPNSASAPYTFFINITENDPTYGPDVLVGDLLLPNASGQWINYPYGNGTLATITFETIGEPNASQSTITSNLTLNDTVLVENLNATDIADIPTNLVNGAVQIAPPTFTYGPAEPSAGEVVIFKVTEPPNHAPLTYDWNFGDGITMTTTSPSIDHAFPSGGDYNVSLTVMLNGAEATTDQTVAVESYAPLGVTADVGSLHFSGEQAEFTILTTDSGKLVNATSLEAKLYYNGTLLSDLSGSVEQVDTGFYRIPYDIPSDAQPGEYTLLVEAEYYGANGAAMAQLTISQTLTGLITNIQNGIATINGISMNLTAINATLAGLEVNNGQTLATINTSVGTLSAKLDTINAKLGDINGNTVTVSSMLGDITTKLDGIQSTATTTMYAATVLSAIAVILALIILLFVRKK